MAKLSERRKSISSGVQALRAMTPSTFCGWPKSRRVKETSYLSVIIWTRQLRRRGVRFACPGGRCASLRLR